MERAGKGSLWNRHWAEFTDHADVYDSHRSNAWNHHSVVAFAPCDGVLPALSCVYSVLGNERCRGLVVYRDAGLDDRALFSSPPCTSADPSTETADASHDAWLLHHTPAIDHEAYAIFFMVISDASRG